MIGAICGTFAVGDVAKESVDLHARPGNQQVIVLPDGQVREAQVAGAATSLAEKKSKTHKEKSHHDHGKTALASPHTPELDAVELHAKTAHAAKATTKHHEHGKEHHAAKHSHKHKHGHKHASVAKHEHKAHVKHHERSHSKYSFLFKSFYEFHQIFGCGRKILMNILKQASSRD